MEKSKKYNGWLLSDNFFKRSLAVFGYAMAGQLIIFGILFILLTYFTLIGSIFSFIF